MSVYKAYFLVVIGYGLTIFFRCSSSSAVFASKHLASTPDLCGQLVGDLMANVCSQGPRTME